MTLQRIFLAVLGLLALLSAPAAAVNFPPRPQGPIYDEADLLPAAEEAQLDQRLRDFDAKTGDAVIVATVNSLQNDTVEDYAANLFKTWGIGGAQRDTGVLLLIAPNERQMRIEVGYGLTPYITDILSGRIIRDDITPRFKQGDMAGGIEAGVNDILGQLSKSPEDAKAVAEAAAAAEKNAPHAGGGGGFPIGAFVWMGFIVFFVVLPAFRRRGGRLYGGGVGSTVGNILLWSALSSMGGGRGRSDWGGGGGGGFGGGGGGGFGGFGGGMSGGGGASGGW